MQQVTPEGSHAILEVNTSTIAIQMEVISVLPKLSMHAKPDTSHTLFKKFIHQINTHKSVQWSRTQTQATGREAHSA